jgi:hypothetical protein
MSSIAWEEDFLKIIPAALVAIPATIAALSSRKGKQSVDALAVEFVKFQSENTADHKRVYGEISNLRTDVSALLDLQVDHASNRRIHVRD